MLWCCLGRMLAVTVMHPTPLTRRKTLTIVPPIEGIRRKQIVHRTPERVVLQVVMATPQEGVVVAVAVADMEAAADTVEEGIFQTNHPKTIRTTLLQEVTRSLAGAEVTLEVVAAGGEDLLTKEINSTLLHPTAICLPR